MAPETGSIASFGCAPNALPALSAPIAESVDAFLSRVEVRRQVVGASLDSNQRSRLGQYFTPTQAAELIAEMVRLPKSGSFRILDPGAGTGSLAAALIARIARERPAPSVSICAIEVDDALIPHLTETLQEGHDLIASHGRELNTEVICGDFVELCTGWSRAFVEQFDLVIMNPPYRKLGAFSREYRALSALGVQSPNLYSAFLALGTQVLVPGGQLVAITPRSFANGPYFGAFRRFFLSQVSFDRIHVFDSRSIVFGDAGVLQENVIFSATRGAPNGNVLLSVSRGHRDGANPRTVGYDQIVHGKDRYQFIHIPAGDADTEVAAAFARLPCTIDQLCLEVSTGKVVDFRVREHLLSEPCQDSVPLVYPGNLRDGCVQWPLSLHKPQALAITEATQKLILPNERFVLTKRFSAKEERRRVVAAIYEPEELVGPGVGFENHLNVFHVRGRGLDHNFALGLGLWLNGSAIDRYFRTFSGHTQVNATDLRSLRYPSRQQLIQLGEAGSGGWPDQAGIDSLIDVHVFASPDHHGR